METKKELMETKIKLEEEKSLAESNLGITNRFFNTGKEVKNPEVLFGEPVDSMEI